MKKALGFLIVGFVFLGSCSVQNANAQSSNDAQRILGTWKVIRNSDSDGTQTETFTFNSNGTFTYSFIDTGYSSVVNRSENGNYFVSGTNLILTTNSRDVTIYTFYLSTNGNRLVFNDLWREKQ